jgi:hypothetical protein
VDRFAIVRLRKPLWEDIMSSSTRKSVMPTRAQVLTGNQHKRRPIPATAHNPRRRFLSLAAGAATLPAMSRISWAQAYPSKPITVIVPFAAGGGLDVSTRTMAEAMRVSLGQPIIIENVTGAAGSIGVGRAARAAPDGYTLVAGQLGTHVLNGAMYALPYDLLNDFAPISLVATQPLLIVAKKAVPADDLKGLIAWLKANPGKATMGSAGVGSQVASFLSKGNRYAVSTCTISRFCSCPAGLGGRPDRLDDSDSGRFVGASARRNDQGACRYCEEPPVVGTKYPDSGRGWCGRVLRQFLDGDVGSQSDGKGCGY